MASFKMDKKDGLVLAFLFFLFLWVGYHCPFRFILGIPCPGCGMTRALFAALQGDWQTSLYMHALLIPTILLALFTYLKKGWRKYITWIWITMMIAYYVYRMFVIFPRVPMDLNEQSLVFMLIKYIL